MSTITREWLQQKIADMEATRDEIPFGLDEGDSNTLAAMKMALASLEAEPVAFRSKLKPPAAIGSERWDYTDHRQPDAFEFENCVIERLFTAPPAPASVPDENGLLPCPCCGGKSEFDYDDDNLNWISCNVCGISTDTAYHTDVDAKDKLREVWNRRAAMLQGVEQQNQQQNIPENIPATQFKPVADLYGITSPTGSETSFTFDAVEARNFIDGGWSCQEYVELERYQEAVACNSPVIPDGWVACSERMPKKGEEVLCTDQFENYETALYDTGYIPGPPFFATTAGEFHPTHWMPLPAAPQQEVK
ncbi:Lar family restriction alleviation protein [Citrobacter amalonaticus]